jgi:hypothetical protein
MMRLIAAIRVEALSLGTLVFEEAAIEKPALVAP